jgi:hypothetical protein
MRKDPAWHLRIWKHDPPVFTCPMEYAGSTFYILMVHSQLRRIHLLRHLILFHSSSATVVSRERPCCTPSECSVHFTAVFLAEATTGRRTVTSTPLPWQPSHSIVSSALTRMLSSIQIPHPSRFFPKHRRLTWR